MLITCFALLGQEPEILLKYLRIMYYSVECDNKDSLIHNWSAVVIVIQYHITRDSSLWQVCYIEHTELWDRGTV